MPAERLPMRKVCEVLRPKHACGVSERVIARSIGVSRSTVAEYLRRAAVIGLAWLIPDDLDDAGSNGGCSRAGAVTPADAAAAGLAGCTPSCARRA